jgi:WD40 repeat protein
LQCNAGLALSNDCALLASASLDHTTELWDFNSHYLLASLDQSAYHSLVLSLDSRKLTYPTSELGPLKIYVCDIPPACSHYQNSTSLIVPACSHHPNVAPAFQHAPAAQKCMLTPSNVPARSHYPNARTLSHKRNTSSTFTCRG